MPPAPSGFSPTALELRLRAKLNNETDRQRREGRMLTAAEPVGSKHEDSDPLTASTAFVYTLQANLKLPLIPGRR